MESIEIKGKLYVTVNERLKEFAKLYPNGAIQTHIIKNEGEEIIIRATIWPDITAQDRCFTGHARELASSSYINKTSHVENCETSAVGRALGMLGIGIHVSVASADEVTNAIINQNTLVDKQRELIKILGDEVTLAKEIKATLGIKHMVNEMTPEELDRMIIEARKVGAK